jgi:2-desacetyl-2-hydroxyethyl bacteriochlorophyllide A dehydrogenase
MTIPQEGAPHAITGEVLPLTMGHEFCGRVSQVGANSKLKIGQAVMVDPRFYCSSCHRCDLKATNACYSWGFRGLQGGGGGLSEVVAADEDMCHVLDDNADLSVAALIEPLTVAEHAIKSCGVTDFASKSVLILGGGPIGLVTIMVLRTKGAKAIYVSEPTKKRQEQNLEVADAVLDPFKENIGSRCRELTGGVGVDVIFDCAGNEHAMKDGMDALKWGGLYMNVAGWVTPVSYSVRSNS